VTALLPAVPVIVLMTTLQLVEALTASRFEPASTIPEPSAASVSVY
jgi:hypothetical protein